ncbi:hypothetical protein KCP74_13830 [Salmonella enterica subsp. enterica]|nr:hypothetical protein KCP74_13830 [Salmonella enterica subsp. enterica]
MNGSFARTTRPSARQPAAAERGDEFSDNGLKRRYATRDIAEDFSRILHWPLWSFTHGDPGHVVPSWYVAVSQLIPAWRCRYFRRGGTGSRISQP